MKLGEHLTHHKKKALRRFEMTSKTKRDLFLLWLRHIRAYTLAIHDHLSEKSGRYKAWHKKPHHKKVHWAIFHGHNTVWALVLGFFIIQSLSVGPVVAATTRTVTNKEDWEAGTLTNIETEDPNGEIKLTAAGSWGTRAFKTPPDTITTGAAGIFEGGKFYVLRGNYDNAFWRYDPTKNLWSDLANAPVGVGTGADLAADGNGTLYVIFGQYIKTFYKYTIASNTWDKLADISDVTGPQSSLVFAASKVYLLRSNNSQDFFSYDPGTNEWTSANILPAAAGNGSDIVYDGNRYIYALRGNGAPAASALYRFDTQTPGWVLITTTGMPTNSYQTSMAYVPIGGGSLYIQNIGASSTTNFYKCNISGTTCPASATTSFPAVTSAGALTYNSQDSLIYALRGSGTYDFWKFDPSTNTFIGPSLFGQPALAAPVAFSTGGDLVYDGTAGIYGFGGGAPTNRFFYYSLSTGAWSAKLTTGMPTLSYDTKAVKAGDFIYLFSGNATTFYQYSIAGNSWTTKTAAPATALNGASLAYPGSGDLIYATRGGGTNTFWAYSITNNNWTTLDPTDLPVGSNVNIGGRLAANGTDIYAILGVGNTAFYKYNIVGNSWSQVGRTPFIPYYGTDIALSGSKIYAVSGNYSFATYEFDGSNWRKTQDLPKYSQASPYHYDSGAWTGSSIEVAGASGIFVARGNGSAEVLNMSIGTANYQSIGTYVSPVLDLTHVSSWISLAKTVTTPGDSSATFQTQSSQDGTSWSSWAAVTGDNINSDPARYLKIKITLLPSTDLSQTPTVSSYEISFNPDEEAPTNPSSIVCSSQQVGGEMLTSETAYRHRHPFCVWSGASDAGSGIAGYYVYIGTDPNADPANPSTGAFFSSSAEAVFNSINANGNNYIRIKTKDIAGNVSALSYQGFIYNYQGVAPLTTITKTSTADFSGTLSGLAGANDQLKLDSKSGFWKESRLTPAPTTASAASIVAKPGILYEARGNSVTFDSYNIATDLWNSPNPADLPIALSTSGKIVNGPGDYVYAIRGGAQTTQNFYRFDGTSWTDLTSLAPIPGTISTGSDSVYDGQRYIYVMRGNSDDGFYRYDTSGTNGQWTTRANINFGFPNQTNVVYPTTGSGLVFDGNDTLYALQGSYTGGFAKYTISTNTWTPLDPLPMIPGGGSTIVWDAQNNQLLFVPGNNSNKLFGYDPTEATWSTLANGPIAFSTGTATNYLNGKMYVIRGGTTAFYQYDVVKDSWYLPTVSLFGTNFLGSTNFNFGPGAAMARDESENIYLLRGNYDNAFVRYNTRTGISTRMTNLPTGAFDGATLTYVSSENSIYAIAGNGCRAIFKYSIPQNSWTELTSDLVPAAAPPGTGTSLTWDGGQYLYYLRGVATNAWYRYDLNGSDGSRWSSALSVTGLTGVTFGAGSEVVIRDNRLYVMRAQGNMTFYSIDLANPTTGTWSTLAALPTTPAPFTATTIAGDAFLVDGNDGYLYLAKGNTTNEWYRYNISGNSWERVANIPSVVYAGTTNGGANGVAISEKIFATAGNTAAVGAYNDGLLSYITQTSNTSFVEEGIFTSDSIDLNQNYDWANLLVDFTTPTNTTVKIETASSSDNSNWSSWSEVSNLKTKNSGKEFVINSPVGRYLKVRVTLNSGDGINSPTVNSFAINYYQDSAQPTNPQALASAKSKQADGTDLALGGWTSTVEPYFTLPNEDQANGATDGNGGSGVDCYYVYFGTNQSATPSTQVSCTTSLNYQFSPSENGDTYYLLVQTKDKAGNLQGEIKELFNLKLDTEAPENPSTLAVNPVGYTNVDNYTFTISEDAADTQSGLYKYQYRTGGDPSDVWFDFDPLTGTSVSIPNANHPAGKYRAGINQFYLRVIDNAGNHSGAMNIQYYFGDSAPTPPRSLTAIPETNTENSFTFTWDAPLSYVGDPSKIIYYYSVNAEPTEFNSNQTFAKAAGPDPFATQKGENKFYVVAKDEAGNIDWDQFASASFYADTSAPGSPSSVSVSDISDKEGDEFRLVISWIEPSIGDPSNFDGYDIYESTSAEGPFSKLANTSGTAYVHTNLVKDSHHYYYVVAIDKTRNESAPSSTADAIASGRYRRPPNIVTEPQATPRATTATIRWATSREANSAVEFGTTQNLGQNISNQLTTYVTDHEILLTGLYPGTQYYYKAYFTDPDGNIGISDVGTFLTAPAPKVSGLKVEDITLSSMLITWESNVPSYGSINYGENKNMTASIDEDPYYIIRHTMKISDLSSGNKYYFQIKALDEEGNIFTSDIYEQETLPLPQDSNVKFQNKTGVDSPTVEISYDSNVETTTIVRYSADGTKAKEYVATSYSKKHELEISDLMPLKNYTLYITGRDRYGNEAAAERHNINTLSDTMPPKIEKIIDQKKIVGEGTTAETQLTVKIKTNENSQAVIEAAKGVASSNFNISSSPSSMAADHTISMKLGEPGIPYTYRVRVKDAAGNETVSEIKTLVISSSQKTALEYIVAIFVRNFGWLRGMFE